MHYEIGAQLPSARDALFSAQATADSPPRARTVLIIEDDPLNRKLFRDFLRAKGYEAHAAPDGLSGLALCRELAPDLVLLDVQLPGLGGIEVARAISAEDDPPLLLAISAFAGETEAASLRDAGCVDCLPKPVAIADFLTRIDGALKGAE
jgi:two-component system cell cycle response regulator DivK